MKEHTHGSKKEQKVAQILRNKGASVKSSPDSKGAADLTATFPSGTRWKIHVKASRGSAATSPSAKDIGRLKQVATKSNATPVVAKVTNKGVEYKSARSGRTLNPPSKKGR